MLELNITTEESYNEETQEFETTVVTLQLEHSLSTLSKWESFYEKPFYSDKEKSAEELLHYIRMMTFTPEVSPDVYAHLTKNDLTSINDYITSKQTATWFSEDQENKKSPQQETITAELIYYWMISYQIPMECEHWHLNKLFTLIRVFNVKNQKPKKMSPAEIAARTESLMRSDEQSTTLEGRKENQ